MQVMFVNAIEALMTTHEQIFYIDETSFNCWMRRTKTFSGVREPVIMPYQGERGVNISIIGALNIDTLQSFYQAFRKTDQFNVDEFIE